MNDDFETEFSSVDEFMVWFKEWRNNQRRRPRVMTLGEYRAWLAAGDVISHPSSAPAFQGGLTIHFDGPPIIGRFDDENSVSSPS